MTHMCVLLCIVHARCYAGPMENVAASCGERERGPGPARRGLKSLFFAFIMSAKCMVGGS